MPKVSVIIPNYNHARFLVRRIESVLNQTYRDFEVILLDDASTDDSLDIIKSYSSDPRVRTILNDQNSGSTFKQWNKGFREAQGEYIWIAESDDYADLSLIETFVGRLDSHKSVGLVYSESYRVDEDDNIIGQLRYRPAEEWTSRWSSDFVNNGLDECRRYLSLGCTIGNASAVMFRRSDLESVGYPDSQMRQAGDYMLWAKLLLASDVEFVARPLNFYREHSANVSSKLVMFGVTSLESYMVAAFIAQVCPLDPEQLEAARRNWFDLWVEYARGDKFSWKMHARIRSIASQCDPMFSRRVLGYRLRRCTDILRSAKRVLSVGHPGA